MTATYYYYYDSYYYYYYHYYYSCCHYYYYYYYSEASILDSVQIRAAKKRASRGSRNEAHKLRSRKAAKAKGTKLQPQQNHAKELMQNGGDVCLLLRGFGLLFGHRVEPRTIGCAVHLSGQCTSMS